MSLAPPLPNEAVLLCYRLYIVLSPQASDRRHPSKGPPPPADQFSRTHESTSFHLTNPPQYAPHCVPRQKMPAMSVTGLLALKLLLSFHVSPPPFYILAVKQPSTFYVLCVHIF